ncbi:MAG: hypothetical protein HRT47_12800 [Candidatus Caenarcaniphilales bacterium]|nr:hypothetical protein [Candidatus Caenarcaniphilales bacterium]
MGVGNFGISPSQLTNSAFAKQSSQLEQRIVEKDTNRKDIQRIGGNVAAYNRAESEYRTARAVNKQLSSTLDGMIDASNGITDIRSKLQNIQSIVQDSIDGNIVNLDDAQENINTYVREIQEIISTTEFKDKKLFDGNFEVSTLKDIDVSKLDLDFRNTETGTVAPPPEAPPLPGGGGLNLTDSFNGPTGQGVLDDMALVKDTAFGTLTEQGNADLYGVAINDNYLVEGYNVDTGDSGIKIYDRTDGSLVVDISDAQLGNINVPGSNLAINENDQIIVAGYDSVVLVDGFSTGSPGTITQLLDTGGAAWDPDPSLSTPIQVEISNGYAVASTDGGANNAQELLVWDLSDTGGALAAADYDFSYNNVPANGRGGADVAINGDQLIVGGRYNSGGGFAQIYDMNTGATGRRFELTVDNAGVNFGQNVEFTSDGTKAIIAAGTETRIYNISDGSLDSTITHGQNLAGPLAERDVSDFEIDGDTLYISAAGDSSNNSRILAYDITNGTLEDSLATNSENTEFDVYNGSLAARTNQVISIPNTHNIEVFDYTNVGSTINEDNFGEEVVMTDRYLAVGTPGYDTSSTVDDNVGAVNIYDRLSGNLITTIQGYSADNPLAISGDTLSLGGENGVELYDLANNGNLIDTLGSGKVDNLAINENHIIWRGANNFMYKAANDGVYADSMWGFGSNASLSLDGDTLIRATQDDGMIEIYDLSSGVSLTETIENLYMSNDMQVSASDGLFAVSYADASQSIRIYDYDGNLQNTISAPPGSVDFGQSIDLDGTRLAVGDYRANGNAGAAYLYDITSATLVDTLTPPPDSGDGLNFYGSDVAIVGDDIAVGSIRGVDGVTNEQAGYVNIYSFMSDGTSIMNPYDDNPSSLAGSGLDLNIFSQQAGSMGAGTFFSLADISVSMTTASLGGQTNLGTYEDIYSIDQMLSNLDSMQTLVDTQINELTDFSANAETIEKLTKDTFDLYSDILPESQVADPNIALNLLP